MSERSNQEELLELLRCKEPQSSKIIMVADELVKQQLQKLDIADVHSRMVLSGNDSKIKLDLIESSFGGPARLEWEDHKLLSEVVRVDWGSECDAVLAVPLVRWAPYESHLSHEVDAGGAGYLFVNDKAYLLAIKSKDSADLWGEYSEISWLDVDLVVFIGALTLVQKYGSGTYCPSELSMRIPLGAYGMEIEAINSVADEAIRDLVMCYDSVYSKLYTFDRDLFVVRKDCHDRVEIEDVREILKALDPIDRRLVRCLYCFTKANILRHRHLVMEEATGLLYFCLDGVVKLLMEKWQLTTIENVFTKLNKDYQCPYAPYLRECYEERTIYVHPVNHYGDFSYPNWSVEDCFETVGVARKLLRLLILDRVDEW